MVTAPSTTAHNQRKGERQVACRECQRLKLRCTRSWPCESCVKRGVGDICPEGVLPTTKGHRTNLIDTSRLYEKNEQMSIRIRQLESALATLQSNVSDHTHPLLRDEFLHVGTPLPRPPEIEKITSSLKPTVDETIDAFGTLKITPSGRTVFHNQAVSADYLVDPAYSIKERDRAIAEALVLPAAILELGTLFPFGDARAPLVDVKRQILSYLPPASKASHLAENYFSYFTWWSDPIPREQFEKELYPIILAPDGNVRTENLSALFMIFAIGTILDVDAVPLQLTTADAYWQLSRAAFCLEPLLYVSTTSAIQAVQLMVAYDHFTNREKLEQQWMLLGLVSRLVHSSGLHLDPENWIKDEEIVQRRRKVLHESMAYDILLSFLMGRPPAFKLAFIQCKYPVDDERFTTETGVKECGFQIWRYRFTTECALRVMEEAFGAKAPRYSTILQLDRTLREYPVPPHLAYPGLGSQGGKLDSEGISFRIWMQRAFLFCLKEISILCLHRAHFARAVRDNPGNPLEGKYAASVLAVFRSASRIIAVVRNISSRYETPVSRAWWLWQNIFSAGIVLAMVVVRSPRCKLAKLALSELQNAHDLFQSRAVPCRSEHYRTLMARLRSTAEDTFQHGTPLESLSMLGDDELVLFTAATCTISNDGPLEPTESMLMPQVEGLQDVVVSSWNDAHPDLMQYFSPLNQQADSTNGHSDDTSILSAVTPSSNISDPGLQSYYDPLTS